MQNPADDAELARLARRTGPVLHLRRVDDAATIAAVLVRPAGEAPVVRTHEGDIEPAVIFERYGLAAFQYTFDLPLREDAWYEADGERYTVNCAYEGDLRIAFVSCNGQEQGDRERPSEERNILWGRLGRQHDAAPLNLLLHGGDQIYADEILDAHPLTREWDKPGGDPGTNAHESVPEIEAALARTLFQRYLELFGQREPAYLLARVPSLAMWDDHDICDGWGSLRDKRLDSPVGKAVFRVAREHFLLFQLGCSDDDLPETVIDRTGTSLGWHAALPGLHVIAPDLRSERRRSRVMGENGWNALSTALSRAEAGRVLLVSSVPALGPRLSIVEQAMRLTPWMEKYEDDLRDQWQSRSHREEWRRFLRSLLAVHESPETRVTVISGEIHLATRGTLESSTAPLHQLVASGITHPPPPAAYARGLGTLARLGESPLPDHPIRLHPLPGLGSIYCAERNYLMITRTDGRWRSWWELEETGPTPALDLGA